MSDIEATTEPNATGRPPGIDMGYLEGMLSEATAQTANLRWTLQKLNRLVRKIRVDERARLQRCLLRMDAAKGMRAEELKAMMKESRRFIRWMDRILGIIES